MYENLGYNVENSQEFVVGATRTDTYSALHSDFGCNTAP